MKERKLQTFVEVVRHYFAQFKDGELVVDTPYLFEGGQPSVYEYTGIIGVSGIKRGVIYVSVSDALLQCVLHDIGEADVGDLNKADLVGEIANTIAGNARTEFGPEFHISTPFVFKGTTQSVTLPKNERAFIIPILWKEQIGEIVVCLED